MAINPGIALGVQPSQPLDMLGAYGKAMSIKNLVDGARLQQQQGAAMSQKMQFDQQDNALSLAGKKIGIRQQLASGLIALPPEQRAAQYPFFRQQYIDLTGDSNIPGEYDEGLVMQTALLGQNPDKMQEAVRMEAQRARFAALQGQAYGNAPGATPGGMPTTTDVGDGTRVAMPMQPVDERDMTPEKRAERQMSVRDLVARDPMLIGTQFEKDATDRALQLSKEARDDAGAGLSTIKGADGNTYVVRNGVIVNGGKPLDTGMDPNADFWADPKTGLPIPNQAALDAKDRRAKLGASNISLRNETKEQDESSKVIGKGYGEQYTTIQQSEFASRKRLGRAERLEQLLDGVQTGKLTPIGTQLAGYAHALGFEIDPKLGNKEAAIALENEMALELRNPAGGAGMPGAMSDADRNFLQNMSSFTNKTTQGRKLMMETYKAIAKRDAEIAKLARDYKKRNGGKFDEGFYDEISVWSAQNPLFPDADAIAKEKAKRGLK